MKGRNSCTKESEKKAEQYKAEIELLCQKWSNDNESYTFHSDGLYYLSSKTPNIMGSWKMTDTEIILSEPMLKKSIPFEDLNENTLTINSIVYYSPSYITEKNKPNFAKEDLQAIEVDIDSLLTDYFYGIWASKAVLEFESEYLVFQFMEDGTLNINFYFDKGFGTWKVENPKSGSWSYSHKTGNIWHLS